MILWLIKKLDLESKQNSPFRIQILKADISILIKVACSVPFFHSPDVRTKGIYDLLLIDPTQVESKKSSQIQWPVPSINAEPVDIFLGEE